MNKITLELESDTIYVGGEKDCSRTLIRGSVKFDLRTRRRVRCIVVSLIRKEYIEWVSGFGSIKLDHHITYQESQIAEVSIEIDEKNSLLSPGEHLFDFNMWVPDDVDPSILSKYGDIKYTLLAKVYKQRDPLSKGLFGFGALNCTKVKRPLKICRVPFKSVEFFDVINSMSTMAFDLVKTPDLQIRVSAQSRFFTECGSNNKSATLVIKSTKEFKPISIRVRLLEEIKYTENKSPHNCTTLTPIGSYTHNFTESEELLPNEDEDGMHMYQKSGDEASGCEKVALIDESTQNTDITMRNTSKFQLPLPTLVTEPTYEFESGSIAVRHHFECVLKGHFGDDVKKIFSSRIKVVCIPSWAEKFSHALPLYDESMNDILVTDSNSANNALVV
ncbi:hypothetical protein AX774_g5086 [Zancudomyces culisetae]|uniref:Arrestin-like N-terminal domain-containing protein n=1 Tax=Zancudomyces culisetae TaxID=1213189 RepID=A0A1R1PKG9_ZANCU|nr:hypothetical protein AX774_g5086 [Zancudomyces culisetae]|eukprot:OMH81455.1 hypothetical protein AX774_g5086 [Zancudomyces culisetae]